MGVTGQNAERALGRAHVNSLLESTRLEAPQREPLLHCRENLVGRRSQAEGKFSHGEPVDNLTTVARQRYIHFAKKLPQELSAEVGAVIRKLNQSGGKAGKLGVHGDDLAFPFGLEQIPVQLNSFGSKSLLL